MDRRFSINIDHCSVFDPAIENSARVFYSLGFTGEGDSRRLNDTVKNDFVPSLRFVFDNAYIECAQFPASLEEFYCFQKEKAGMHLMTLQTDSAEGFRTRLLGNGLEAPPVDTTTRENADHGTEKGTARFLLVPISYSGLPETHVAFLEHLTRNLIYQPGRYRHDNTVETLEELVLIFSDEAAAASVEEKLTELNSLANGDSCEGGLRDVRMMDSVSFFEEFGCEADEKNSVFSALVFGVSDLALCRQCVERSIFEWHEKNETIFVDLCKELGLVFCFRVR